MDGLEEVWPWGGERGSRTLQLHSHQPYVANKRRIVERASKCMSEVGPELRIGSMVSPSKLYEEKDELVSSRYRLSMLLLFSATLDKSATSPRVGERGQAAEGCVPAASPPGPKASARDKARRLMKAREQWRGKVFAPIKDVTQPRISAQELRAFLASD
ncbi:hypothetical protein K523DRAFT_83256 [Schizophyllum commune Tattone D]|nr:hypothetical protein K523DRAFT_83256 [Schizophyllum commune Tattone D]